jgi:2-dehydropantoate 2-reductase
MVETASDRPRVVVVGAGLIGSFVGGLLAYGGADVVFLVREGSVGRHAEPSGLACARLGDGAVLAPAGSFRVIDDPAVVTGADLVLVCVKSSATIDAASRLRGRLGPETPVVSLQNGMENAPRLRQVLPGARVLAGLVAFNVVSDGPGSYRQTTTGGLCVEEGAPSAVQVLKRTGLGVEAAHDITALQWGKLLINLNNALVALADVTLKEELDNRGWRRVWVRQVDEAMAAMKARGIEPRIPGPKLKVVLMLLKLPNFLYRLAASRSIKVDPAARSSMWEDLAHNRPTEIDELQGAIVRLAAQAGTAAPVNARVLALIKGVEAGTVKRPVRPDEVLSGAYSAA